MEGVLFALQEKALRVICQTCGEMSEWFKEHAWKVCVR